MTTRRIRSAVAVTAALFAALATTLAPMGSASADDYELSFSATVDQVLVNRYGGITVSGSLDCSEQVAAFYAPGPIPENTTVMVDVDWTATQYVGRGKVVRATYLPAIAHPCFTNDPTLPIDDVEAPWQWQTRYPYPGGQVQWVYSDTGKFAAGPIHVDIDVSNVGYAFTVGEDTYTLVNFSGWNLRATKVR